MFRARSAKVYARLVKSRDNSVQVSAQNVVRAETEDKRDIS